jgi:hypothetical protein
MPLSTIDSSGLAAAGIARTNMYAGAVLQVVQTQKTSVFSTTSSSYVDITGLSASITPSSATSKILVSVVVNASANPSGWYGGQIKLLRDSTDIAIGDASGSNPRLSIDYSTNVSNATLILPCPLVWLDSPATTSSVTYKLQMRTLQSIIHYINQSTYVNGTAAYNSMVASTITLMEVAA